MDRVRDRPPAVVVMVASRWTTHHPIVVDCPVCDHPLPRVMVDADAQADGPGSLWVDLTVQELDAAWWAAARETHPDCVPPGAGPPARCRCGAVLPHDCDYCHDDPPRGHACPRCARTGAGFIRRWVAPGS